MIGTRWAIVHLGTITPEGASKAPEFQNPDAPAIELAANGVVKFLNGLKPRLDPSMQGERRWEWSFVNEKLTIKENTHFAVAGFGGGDFTITFESSALNLVAADGKPIPRRTIDMFMASARARVNGMEHSAPPGTSIKFRLYECPQDTNALSQFFKPWGEFKPWAGTLAHVAWQGTVTIAAVGALACGAPVAAGLIAVAGIAMEIYIWGGWGWPGYTPELEIFPNVELAGVINLGTAIAARKPVQGILEFLGDGISNIITSLSAESDKGNDHNGGIRRD